MAQTMKIRSKRCSYSRLPSARAVFDVIAGSADFTLLLRRTMQRIARASGCRRMRFADARMAAKRLDPIGFAQIVPTSSQAASRAASSAERPASGHAHEPRLANRSKAEFLLRLLGGKAIPARQHILLIFQAAQRTLAIVREIRRPDCPPPPRDIAPWSECRRSGGPRRGAVFRAAAMS